MCVCVCMCLCVCEWAGQCLPVILGVCVHVCACVYLYFVLFV